MTPSSGGRGVELTADSASARAVAKKTSRTFPAAIVEAVHHNHDDLDPVANTAAYLEDRRQDPEWADMLAAAVEQPVDPEWAAMLADEVEQPVDPEWAVALSVEEPVDPEWADMLAERPLSEVRASDLGHIPMSDATFPTG